MFEKWDIPNDICDSYPIGYDNLDLFVGHAEQTRFLSDLLSNKSLVILEGDIGVGKTSMGNYIRHSKKGYFTPLLEIPCKRHWDNDIFLGIVLAAIVKEIVRKDSPHGRLKKFKIIKTIDELFSDVKLANLGISGAGFGIQKGEAISRSALINQTVLLEYLLEVGKLIRDQYRQAAPIIIQVNNLDIKYGFEEQDLIRLFNDIRDTLQEVHISWIVCGDTGLGNFLRSDVPRLGQIINNITSVNPLSFEEILQAFRLRVKRAGMGGELPVDHDLLKLVYKLSNGSFRAILNIVYQLLVKYYNEPLVKTINFDHARFFFNELGKPAVENLKRSKSQYAIFEAILNNPGINQKDLTERSRKQQSNVSRITRELETQGFIEIKKKGRTNYYWPDVKYHLGFSQNPSIS